MDWIITLIGTSPFSRDAAFGPGRVPIWNHRDSSLPLGMTSLDYRSLLLSQSEPITRINENTPSASAALYAPVY